MATRGRPKNKTKKVPKELVQLRKCAGSCGKELHPNNFYNTNNVLSDGKSSICKKCTKDMINYNDMQTIYTVLQGLDLPFLYSYWATCKEKNPEDPWSIYIRMANSKINEFKTCTWKDSVFQPTLDNAPTSNNTQKTSFVLTSDMVEKWGNGYQVEEYEAFERKYNFLKNNYPQKTAMHTEALLNYIRYRVKEEISTAIGNVKDAKEWGSLANAAATAAKINPSQLSKADLTDGLSTFGELVRAVEQAEDIIPILPKFKERPQDKVDFTIWCYINYVRDLKGLPPCEYAEVYKFYEERKNEYKKHSKKEDDFFEDEEEDGEE